MYEYEFEYDKYEIMSVSMEQDGLGKDGIVWMLNPVWNPLHPTLSSLLSAK